MDTYEWVMSHMNESCHTYECVTTWMSHVSYLNVWCDTYECITSHVCISHITIRMSHVPHMNESCPTYKCIMSHMNKPYHTYEWAMSHKWMNNATHINKSGLWPISSFLPLSPSPHSHIYTHTLLQTELHPHTLSPSIIQAKNTRTRTQYGKKHRFAQADRNALYSAR